MVAMLTGTGTVLPGGAAVAAVVIGYSVLGIVVLAIGFGAGQAELADQVPGAAAGLAAGQAVEPADHGQVLLAGQERVHRRVLPGQADQPPHRLRLLRHVESRHPCPAPVGPEQGGQDPHHRRFPRPVGAQQPEHAAGRQHQVHPVQRGHQPEALADPLGHDRRVGHLPAPHRLHQHRLGRIPT
jgi:hypothetical protein